MQPRGNHVSDQIIHKEVGVELYICLQADSPWDRYRPPATTCQLVIFPSH